MKYSNNYSAEAVSVMYRARSTKGLNDQTLKQMVQ